MNIPQRMELVLVAMVAAFLSHSADAATPQEVAGRSSFGTIVGVITNASHAPVSGATVTAIKSQDGSIRATVSGSDGVYSFPDLPLGTWSVSAEVQGSRRRAR